MLARIQRLLVLGLVCAALGTAAWLRGRGWAWPPTMLLALAVFHAHAWVLAAEFLALSRVDPGPDVPRAGPVPLLRAWWGEVWTGLQVFGWRQPFRADVVPDHLPPQAARRPGVVFVHGFVCNRGLWAPLMRRLRAEGIPCVAVNLEPVFGSIDRYVPIIDDAVQRLHGATGHPPLVVAHSMGGLAVRAWLHQHQADAQVRGVVTIGTPHRGTWLARWGLSPNTRQMRIGGPWLAALGQAEPAARRARFTCFFSHCDNIVFPADRGMLPGADNRHLPGVAHVHLAFQPEVFDAVLAKLAAAPS